MRVLVLCITIAMLALGVLGCQQAQETAEQAETETEMDMQMEGSDEGAMEETALMDPVCNMKVTEESEWTAEYEGVTFYFCSEACRDSFVEEPGKYLEEMGEEVIGT